VKSNWFYFCVVTAVAITAAAILLARNSHASDNNPPGNLAPANSGTTVELSADQLNAIKIGTVRTYPFSVKQDGIGTIDFENDLYSDPGLSTPVYPPSTGKIIKVFVELGDEIQRNGPLYSIESPDDQKELIVRSPITGQIASVNATPGLLAQPSVAPAPCAVADVSKKWLLANVPESDSTAFQVGQKTEVKIAAFPGQVFDGKISKIYPTVDLSTHRLTLRAEISDPSNELRAGMLADFSIEVQKPVKSPALSENGVVREGDGTMTVWTTTDRRHFTQNIVKIGLRENGEAQILNGLKAGQLAVTDGAIFLDNILNAPPDD
jgi:multidrug efflux pump subunit AcrA (membrane-fusion protein)